MKTDDFFGQVAAATAAALARRAAEEHLQQVNEQKHLQPACSHAANLAAAGWDPKAIASTQLRLLFAEWPRVGCFDLALTEPGRNPTVAELKCGSGMDALGPCVWDAMKCALALQRGVVSAAYLLAGAPTKQWSKPIRGGEFLATGSWQAADLRVTYKDWWCHWQKLGDPQPNLLPISFETIGVGIYPFVVAGGPWELRLARVARAAETSLAWPQILTTSSSP
jgi:hypothetical protein